MNKEINESMGIRTADNKWIYFGFKGKYREATFDQIEDNDLLDIYTRSIRLHDSVPGYSLQVICELRKEIYRRLKSK